MVTKPALFNALCVSLVLGFLPCGSARSLEFEVNGPNYLADSLGISSLVTADVNSDRRADLIVNLNNLRLVILTQNRQGELEPFYDEPIWSTDPMALLGNVLLHPADLDGDGLLDIVVSHLTGLVIFSGTKESEGNFERQEFPVEWSSGLGQIRVSALVDVDGDHRQDLVFVRGSRRIEYLRNAGDGTFESAQLIEHLTEPYDDIYIAGGDINSDGRQDVVVVLATIYPMHGSRSQFVLYINDGAGSFDRRDILLPDLSYTRNFVVADVTNDGLADIVFTNRANRPAAALVVLPQLPDHQLGAWIALPTYDAPATVVAADIDGDRITDVVVNHPGWMAVSIFTQRADRLVFDTILHEPLNNEGDPQGIAVADINGDRCTDIIIADAGAYFIAAQTGCEHNLRRSLSHRGRNSHTQP